MFCLGICIDPLWLGIFVVSIIISAAAQLFVSSQYKKWGNVRNGPDLSGREVGFMIVNRTPLGGEAITAAPAVAPMSPEVKKLANLRDKGIITQEEFEAKRRQIQGRSQASPTQSRPETSLNRSSIAFERAPGRLSDHYDPRSHTVRMSDEVATRHSVASMAIVAHELGHAQQHENRSFLITMRNFLVPAVRFSPQIAYLMILIGLLFNLAGAFWLGILFYGLMVLFSLLTLPVELDASRRGLQLLSESGLMQTEEDKQGSRRVLAAAATTYIAAAVTAVLQLLYYISLARRRR